ncbi:MAG: ADOP family duplicated permease [Gemmatimonadota bacterium]
MKPGGRPGSAGALRPGGVRGWFRLRPDTSDNVAQQVEEEIALHMELRVRELMSRGMSAAEARAEAKRRFGQMQRARLVLLRAATERERRMSVREWLAGWAQDFSYSARALLRERLLALVIVLTLALGLGANTIMFGIVDHLLLRGPAHVVDADDVRRLYATERAMFSPDVRTSAASAYAAYALLRDHAASVDGAAAYYHRPAGRIGSGETARQVPLAWATHDMFALLGVSPHAGRFYTAAEDRPHDAERVAVIDYAFWQSEYGGSRDALGRTIAIYDADYTIIGVTPPGFTGPELSPVSIWLPLSTGFEPHPDWPNAWGARWLAVIARLAPVVSPEAASAEATRLYRTAAEGEYPPAAEATVSLLPLHYGPAGAVPPEAAVARWLLGVSLIVLLIAAANVMNLLLARVLRRRREVAVRLALGISRGRLARLLLTESLLLATAGLAGALALAHWGGHVIRLALLPDVHWGDPLGGRTMLFAGIAALLTGLLIGLAPVLHAGRQDVTRGLRTGPGEGGGRGSGVRSVLTVAQAALSVVLLVGAGLFVRSLWNASHVDLGIDTDRLLTVSAEFAPGNSAGDGARAEDERRDAFLLQAIANLRADPGVEAAALAIGTPLQGRYGVAVRVPGRDSIPNAPGGGPWITVGSPGYFQTAGTRILRGRGFEEGEDAGTEAVVVVNETMANALWPGEDPLTKCLFVGDESRVETELFDNVPCARVVGIAQDAHSGILQRAVMQYYVPLGQERGIGGPEILVRPRGNAVAFIPELRSRLHALHPGISYLSIDPAQARVDRQVRPWRLGATMFLVFGCLALLIAAVGLYSVMAYGVAQRRTEIGVRMALGARTRGIVAMIVRQGVGLVGVGIVLGAAIALAAGPLIEPLLFRTAGRDALIIAGVGILLAVVAALASIIPAVRAGRTDPLSALRVE